MIVAEFPISLRTMTEASEVVLCVDDNDVLTYCNPAFDKFAAANGAPELNAARVVGTPLQTYLPPFLDGFFREALKRARTTLELWRFEYNCSSAEVFRKFQLTIFPQPDRKEIVFAHSLLVEHPHRWVAFEATESKYRCPHGLLHMCCNCRRTRVQETSRWDWVPGFVSHRPRQVSHGICPFCRDWLYGARPGAQAM
jgi:hypothetical protein